MATSSLGHFSVEVQIYSKTIESETIQNAHTHTPRKVDDGIYINQEFLKNVNIASIRKDVATRKKETATTTEVDITIPKVTQHPLLDRKI